MIPAVQSAVNVSLNLPPPMVASYVTSSIGSMTQTVAVPVGVVGVAIELITCGSAGGDDGTTSHGGLGGGYTKLNRISTTGIPTLHIACEGDFGPSTTVRHTDGSGTVLCKAVAGDNSASGVGDVKRNGGLGGSTTNYQGLGGGAAGPISDGGNGATSQTGVWGLGGGAPAGDGGQIYGGGGLGTDVEANAHGAAGLVRFTWYFE